MWNFFTGLFSGGIGKAATGISRAVSTFTGDKVQQETNIHDEQAAAFASMAAEMAAQNRANRTWLDSFVDGLNRLPRPLMALGIFGEMFVWPIVDPISFAASMQAYALTPEWLALISGQVILLFFGGRMMEKWPKKLSGPSAEEVKAVLKNMNEINAMKPAPESHEKDIPEEIQTEMVSISTPPSLPAIEKWKQEKDSGKNGRS